MDIVDPFKLPRPDPTSSNSSGIVDPFQSRPLPGPIADLANSRPQVDAPAPGISASDIPKEVLAGALQGTGSVISGVGDVGRMIARPIVRAINSVAPGENELPEPVNALERPGGFVSDLGARVADTESDAAKAAKEKDIVTGDITKPETLGIGEGAKSASTIALKGAGLLGQIAPLLAGGLEGRGVKLAADVAEALPGVVAKLQSGAALSEAEHAIATTAAAASKAAARRTIATGAGIGGVQGAEGAAEAERQRITSMSDTDIAAVPGYKDRIAQGMSPEQARADLADAAGSGAFAATLPVATVAGVVSTTPLLHEAQSALSKVAGAGVARRAAVGAAAEAPAQAVLGVGQGAAEAAGANAETGEDRSLTENSAAMAGAGAALGAGFGAIGAAATRPRAAIKPPPVRFPDAEPGSIADAANAAPVGTTVRETHAAGVDAVVAPPIEASVPGSLSEAAETVQPRLAPEVPWIDHESGEFTRPTDDEVKDAFHQLFETASVAGAGMQRTAASRGLSEEWGVPRDRLSTLRKEALAERNDGFKPGDKRPETTPPSGELFPAAEPTEATSNEGPTQSQGTEVDQGKPADVPVESDAAGELAAGRTVSDAGLSTEAKPTVDDATAPVREEPGEAQGVAARDAADAGTEVLPSLSVESEGTRATEGTEGQAADVQPDRSGSGERAGSDGVAAEAVAGSVDVQPGESGVRPGPEDAKPADESGSAPAVAEPPKVEAAALEAAAHPGNDLTEPSAAQQAANNAKAGHVNIHGLDVTIQVPRGGLRRGTDAHGVDWERAASDHYGHIRGTKAADGEQHDVYLGPHAEKPDAKVFVIDQVKPGTRIFDETKSMVGYANGRAARASYQKNFPKGLDTFGGIREMSIGEYKAWLDSAAATKPVTDAVRTTKELAPAVKGKRESRMVLAERAKAATEAAAAERAPIEPGVGDSAKVRAQQIEDLSKHHFDALRKEIGWAEIGGRMIRKAESGNTEKPEVVGRTSWIGMPGPNGEESGFWRGRPDKLNEKQAHKAFDRFAAGHKLTVREQRFIDHAKKFARDYATDEVEASELGSAHEDVAKADAIERLREEHAVKVNAEDHNEALSLIELTQRARAAGLDDMQVEKFASEGPEDYAGRLWRSIKERSSNDGSDTATAEENRAGRAEGDGQRQAAPGAEAAKQAGEKGPALELKTQAAPAPRTETPKAPADMFGEPTARERLDAAARAKDAELAGGDRKQTAMREGDGTLFAGDAPKQEQALAGDAITRPKSSPRSAENIVHEFAAQHPFEDVAELRKAAEDAVRAEHGNAGVEELRSGNFLRGDDMTRALHEGQYRAIRDYAEKMPVPARESDIGIDLATRAHGGTSHTPEDRGRSAVRQYVRTMVDAWRRGEAAAKGDPEALARVTKEMENLQRGYADRERKYLMAHSNVMSAMIAGPAKFPVARNEKRGRTADKRASEANDFLRRVTERMLKAAKAPIDNSPAGELARVRANLAEREAAQSRMKAVNAALRSGDDAPLRALGHTDGQIASLKKPDFAGRTGHPDYQLKNNNAEIRRLRARLGSSEQRVEAAAAPPAESTVAGVRVEESAADDRLRLHFPGKPSEAARADLRGSGWKWSPRNNAWQRQLTNNARNSAKEIIAKHFAEPKESAKGDEFDQGEGQNPKAGAKSDEIRQAVQHVVADWGPDAPAVRVVESAEDLPASAKKDPRYQSARGFYDGNTAYVVASAHADVNSALRSVAHEVIGHYGVDRIVDEFGKGGMEQLVGDINRLREAGLGSDAMKSVMAEVDRRYPNAGERERAREVIAVMAERGIRNGIIGRVISSVKALLRKLFPNLTFSENDIRSMLSRSQDYLTTGPSLSERQDLVRSNAFDQAETAGMTPGERNKPNLLADAQRAWREEGTDSPYFQKFFEGSKVVDKKGEPLVLYHGTGDPDFTQFDDARLGASTNHMSAPLGHFLAEDRAKSVKYAEKAAKGVPADERVIEAYVSIKKPFDMTTEDLLAIDSPQEARSMRAQLEHMGYDGIHLTDADQWVAFDSSQIKSVENRGTFDRTHGDINFSLPEASMDTLDAVLAKPDDSAWQHAKNWMRGKAEDLRRPALGALQTRHLLELAEEHPALKGAYQYADHMQALDADRQQLLAGSPDAKERPHDMLARGGGTIATALRDFTFEKGPAGWFGRRRPEAKALTDVMHDATIYGLDPSAEYQRLGMTDSRGDSVPWTTDGIKARIKEIRGQMRGRPGDDKSMMMDEVKRLRNLPKRENLRARQWPDIVARYQALSPEARDLYSQQRDWHTQMRDETEKALITRIEALGHDIGKNYVRSLQDRIRMQFEGERREGVYFPLDRNGDYWTSFTDKDGQQGFKMFETATDAANAEKKLREAGFTINAQGRRDSSYRAKDAPSGSFVSDIVQMLKKSGAPEKVQDEVYQLFLKSLPEMSMRKHSIHRRNVPGFSSDGLRSFAKNAFHGAHQLARLRHAHEMGSTIEAMEKSLDNYRRANELGASSETGALDVAKGDALLGELKKRHDYIMSPKDTQLANVANSIGFLYYLGASPASAMVNLTQNAQVTLPVLGAHHGWGKASRFLGAAVRDSMRTFGNIDRTLKTEDERQAYNVMRTRGDIDKTQAHTLAGLAEGSLLTSNPVWAKTMSAMTFMFHKAEVINREAAGMAAYRLARSRGDNFEAATKYASDIINGTHFDYSAANRPRIMQGNAARVALQFKNYSLGMTWALYRNLYKSFKGETPEVRSIARKTLTGILGMTAVLAGSMGLPIINALRYGANAAHTLFGDDEPFDFNTEYRAWLAEHVGEDGAKWIADGAVNRLGADIAGRTSLSDLWFREADKELEGQDAYYAMLESVAGPIGGLVKNFFVGSKMVGDGNVERGIETMMPKFAKDAMKATRFAHDGANNLRGDPILPDVSTPESFIQALGFRPTRLAEQQRTNNAMKNYEGGILDRRASLLNALAMATRSGDSDDYTDTLAKIHAFNTQYPEIALASNSIRQSLRARARYTANSDSGVFINKKLAPRLKNAVSGEGADAADL